MERANEETSLVPPLPPSTTPNPDAPVTTSLSNGISVSNGTVFPQPRNAALKDRPVSGIVPPYWSHHRNASRASQISLDQPAITLEDHTEDPDSETSRGLWARSVSVDDHVVVQGKSGIGAYVVWSCTIQTLEGGPITVRMRYSEFDDLRQKLESSFPHAKSALPALPPKSVLFKFRPAFLESRRVGLEYFLNCVLLNPEFSSSPIVKDFLFGRMC
ncbi:PX domain-containing protein ypt35 [Aspergillus alliaceus]|uniref:Endosomal/vacuolar adapter protein YPT35 n=1 Tax=Petromyces alliaceus TaxID=209559 RepID=A0A5N6G7U4_PETAA|nr:Phox homologous domain-containing protein [Aspergillus alliaceus]KAB8238472.1 Phox homologous domain-containing protein [Aspergillus alliaceus]KAE8392255.1 Phox homologous domain-containing protein [Aspergillus alliaceus]KAF5866049.1 PX domain-containing protein ypt35 [Aspergillus burnettii]